MSELSQSYAGFDLLSFCSVCTMNYLCAVSSVCKIFRAGSKSFLPSHADLALPHLSVAVELRCVREEPCRAPATGETGSPGHLLGPSLPINYPEANSRPQVWRTQGPCPAIPLETISSTRIFVCLIAINPASVGKPTSHSEKLGVFKVC